MSTLLYLLGKYCIKISNDHTIAENKVNYFYIKKDSTKKRFIHYFKNVKTQTHLTVIQTLLIGLELFTNIINLVLSSTFMLKTSTFNVSFH